MSDDPPVPPAPWNLRVAWAEAVVAHTLHSLPSGLRTAARQVPVACEAVPSTELLRDGIEADTLGLFVGATRDEQEAGTGLLPAKILLYLDNLWEFAGGDREVFEDEVAITYLHELGHYLGLDEDELFNRGLE
jgi:predicted Zn-dependent protease with MMP-like domain